MAIFPFQCVRSTWDECPQPVGDASLTQQEFLNDCDINHQIALYSRNQVPLPAYQGVDMDYVQDVNATYIDAINAVREVEEAFEQLPSKVRTRFDNDPLQLALFLSDESNRAEAYDLGLVETAPQPSHPPAEQNSAAPDGAAAKPSQEGV